MCEAFGIARYSRPALYDIDRKLERHLDFDGGFFVEAGANDGYAQSNTYYLEKLRRWTGLLVEPDPALAAACRRTRRGPVVEAALVDADVPGATVTLFRAGLMSTIAGAMGSPAATQAHVRLGLQVQRLPSQEAVVVPARTLTALLQQQGVTREIDLLSLDVEGAEPAALRGIDFTRYAPRFICVEARDQAAIEACLGDRYQLVEVLTSFDAYRDLLYRRR